MSDTIEQIRMALPLLEEAVYDPLAKPMLMAGFDDEESREYVRKRVAMGRFCRETSSAGKLFFARMGMYSVKHEMHAIKDWQHHFLSERTREMALSPDDTIIDPTYLQFAKERDVEELLIKWPNVFIGARGAIIELMNDTDFSDDARAAQLYQPHTLITIN